MTYIPDTREKMIQPLFAKEPYENAYWEGNLKEEDAKLVKSFDYAVECADSFFGIYENDLNFKFEKTPTLKKLYMEFLEEIKEDFEVFMEAQRDELVVSMIDGYSV